MAPRSDIRGSLAPGLGRIVAWSMLAATLVHLALVHVKAGSVPRAVLGLVSAGALPAEAEQDRRLDREFAAAAGDRDLFLRFLDHASDPAAEDLFSGLYYRAVYGLYPRRVLVGRDDEVINDGRDLLEANFEPDAVWLASHGSPAVMTLRLRADGGLDWHVRGAASK